MNPIVALIIANLIWGAAPPIFKFSLENIPPFTLAFIRFFFAALIFLPFVKFAGFKSLTKSDWAKLILGSFFGITINIMFFFLGLKRTESINAPIIASASPVFLYFLSIFFLKEKANIKVLGGMIVSLIGVLVIILSPIFLGGKQWVAGEIEGNVFFVIATLGSIVHPLLFKGLFKKLDSYQMTAISFLISSITFLPFMLKELTQWSLSSLNINGWTGIIFGVFFSSALAYFLYNKGLEKISAQEVGMFYYIDPIVAVLIAIPLLHEYPSLYFFLGSFMVFGGIFMAEGRIPWHPFHKLRRMIQ